MAQVPARWARAAEEITAIAAGPGPPAERAAALLVPLRRITPFDAHFVTLFDPGRRRQTPLVRHGYDDRVQRYLDRPAVIDALEAIGLHADRPPMRVKDLPLPAAEVPVWAECLEPAGFREGISLPLVGAGRRLIGWFNLLTADRRPASDAACAMISCLAPVLAHAVDPLRTVTALADVVADSLAGVVVTRDGGILPLPGLPDHPQLTGGSATLAAVAARLAEGDVHTAFLCPAGGGRLLRATSLSCPPQPPGHLRAVVLLSPPGDLHGLTRRELEILGRLVAGWPNARIAAELVITPRTVAAHVERVLAKLGAPSRTAAAVRALRQGLFIPPEVSGAAAAP